KKLIIDLRRSTLARPLDPRHRAVQPLGVHERKRIATRPVRLELDARRYHLKVLASVLGVGRHLIEPRADTDVTRERIQDVDTALVAPTVVEELDFGRRLGEMKTRLDEDVWTVAFELGWVTHDPPD